MLRDSQNPNSTGAPNGQGTPNAARPRQNVPQTGGPVAPKRRVPLRDPRAQREAAARETAQRAAAARNAATGTVPAVRPAPAEPSRPSQAPARPAQPAVQHRTPAATANAKPKARVRDLVLTIAFSVFVIGVGVFACVLPKPAYSESEKRELASAPTLTAKTLFDGSFTDGLDVYFSDTFPLRDPLVDMAASLKKYRGIRGFVSGAKTIYTENDDMYSDENTEHTVDETRFENAQEIVISDEIPDDTTEDTFVPGVLPDDTQTQTETPPEGGEETTPPPDPPKPVGADGPAGEKRGSLYVVGNTALELFRGTETSAQVYAEAVNTYCKYLPEETTVYTMVVPNHTEFALPLSDRSASNEQRPILDAIRDALDEKVVFVDPYNALRTHYENGEYLYFRTDHHWTALGAYYAYCEFASCAGFEPEPLDSYETGRIEPFLGTFYQSSRDEALRASPDYVEYFMTDYPCTVTRYDKDGNASRGKLYYTSVRGEGNAYLSFLGGDFPYIRVTTENKNGRKLIVFKESYGNPLIPFIARHYEEVHVADIRTFPYNAVNFIKQYGIGEVLFVNGIMSANTQARVGDLYALLNR